MPATAVILSINATTAEFVPIPAEFAQSSFFSVFMTAITAAIGIFLVIVPAGMLSGLLMFGVLELQYRARIQRRALVNHFRLGESDERSSPEDTFGKFLDKKYGKEGEAYAETLLRLDKESRLVPTLVQMDANNLYALHYRQIAGQLMTVVNNEAMQSGDRKVFTPLTDVLTFLSMRRNAALHHPTNPAVQTSPDRPPHTSAKESPPEPRVALDLALREIDGIQAKLGNTISKSMFRYAFFAWTVLLGWALVTTTVQPPVLDSPSRIQNLLAILKCIGAMFVPLLVAFTLSLGAAVFGAVVLNWLDRFLASK